MRFNILVATALLLSSFAVGAPVDLSARSDELEDLLFARDPAGPSKIPVYVGTAGIQRPRAPTPDAMTYHNRQPETPPATPPRTPPPRPAGPPSKIPIMKGSNLGKREEAEDIFARDPAGPSKIPVYVGTAGIQRPRAPTPDAMTYHNRQPETPPPTPPHTPPPRPAGPPSKIPIMKGSNLGKREVDEAEDIFARDPAGPSKIPVYVGTAGIQRPRAPTPDAMTYHNRQPETPPATPPRTPPPRPAGPPSKIPIMKGSNLGKREVDEVEDIFARDPALTVEAQWTPHFGRRRG